MINVNRKFNNLLLVYNNQTYLNFTCKFIVNYFTSFTLIYFKMMDRCYWVFVFETNNFSNNIYIHIL